MGDFKLECLPRPSPGKRAQQVGAKAEKVVTGMLAFCEKAGLGRVRKRASATTIEHGTKRYLGTPGCDYSGHMTGGRAVYIEAKHSTVPRLPFDVFSDHQVKELTNASNDGAIAVVVVVLDVPRPAVFAVPWRVIVAAMNARTRESFSLDELKPWALGNVPLLASRAFCEENKR